MSDGAVKSKIVAARVVWPVAAALAIGALVILWPQLSGASDNDLFRNPCGAMIGALVDAETGEAASKAAETFGVSGTTDVPSNFEASSVLCWDSHDNAGTGKIEGVAITNSDSSELWLLFGDEGTSDPGFWEPILKDFSGAQVASTSYGYSSDLGAVDARVDFWDKAATALANVRSTR